MIECPKCGSDLTRSRMAHECEPLPPRVHHRVFGARLLPDGRMVPWYGDDEAELEMGGERE